MHVNVRKICGNWDAGFSLDKHTRSSEFIGYNEFGHPTFETTRSEVGEALYQLKYRLDWSQVEPIAQQLATSIVPRFEKIGLIIPVPPSKARGRQPVIEIAQKLGEILGIPVFEGIITRKAAADGAAQLKDMHTKAEKIAALMDRFELNDEISNEGKWNALVVDDLFDTGASMEAVCGMLRGYHKIEKIFAATVTWK